MKCVLGAIVRVIRDLGPGVRWLINIICRALKHRKLKSKKCKRKTRKTKWKLIIPEADPPSKSSELKRKPRRKKKKCEDYRSWSDPAGLPRHHLYGETSSSESSSSLDDKPRVVLTRITQRNPSERNTINIGGVPNPTPTNKPIFTFNEQEKVKIQKTNATQVILEGNEEGTLEGRTQDISLISGECQSEATTARVSSQETIRGNTNSIDNKKKNYYESYIS